MDPHHPAPPLRGATSAVHARADDVEYYNDLPGKKPPAAPSSSEAHMGHKKGASGGKPNGGVIVPNLSSPADPSNLIDFSTDLSSIGPPQSSSSVSSAVPNFIPRQQQQQVPSSSAAIHEYINGGVATSGRSINRDPFDMSEHLLPIRVFGAPFRIFSSYCHRPFCHITARRRDSVTKKLPSSNECVFFQVLLLIFLYLQRLFQGLQESIRAQLLKEVWFHGPISRRDAEGLLHTVS